MTTTTEKNIHWPQGSPDARARPDARPISPREHEVATLLADGHGVATIALRLHISAHTVRNHLKALYRKVGCRSQRALVGWVRRNLDRPPYVPVGPVGQIGGPGGPRGEARTLTNREREIFRAAATGRRPDEIARDMAISPNTAKNHLKAIYRKLGVRSAVELMARGAHDLGTEA